MFSPSSLLHARIPAWPRLIGDPGFWTQGIKLERQGIEFYFESLEPAIKNSNWLSRFLLCVDRRALCLNPDIAHSFKNLPSQRADGSFYVGRKTQSRGLPAARIGYFGTL
jgi:hypothetical protein